MTSSDRQLCADQSDSGDAPRQGTTHYLSGGDTVRHELLECYRPGEAYSYLRILNAAHIEEDEYFDQLVSDNLIRLVRDIRAAQKKDSDTPPVKSVMETWQMSQTRYLFYLTGLGDVWNHHHFHKFPKVPTMLLLLVPISFSSHVLHFIYKLILYSLSGSIMIGNHIIS